MDEADGGRDLVHVLATVATSPEELPLKIFVADGDLLWVDLGEHCHTSSTGVDATLRLGRWDALDAVDTRLPFEETVGSLGQRRVTGTTREEVGTLRR